MQYEFRVLQGGRRRFHLYLPTELGGLVEHWDTFPSATAAMEYAEELINYRT